MMAMRRGGKRITKRPIGKASRYRFGFHAVDYEMNRLFQGADRRIPVNDRAVEESRVALKEEEMERSITDGEVCEQFGEGACD